MNECDVIDSIDTSDGDYAENHYSSQIIKALLEKYGEEALEIVHYDGCTRMMVSGEAVRKFSDDLMWY